MAPARRLAFALALVLALPLARAAAGADDDADARAAVDRAIQASGGADKLARLGAFTRQVKGKFHGAGTPIDFTGAWVVQFPDRVRETVSSDANGMKYQMVKVIAGDKGWIKEDGHTEDLSAAELAEDKEQLHAARVATLLPLKDKDYALASLGEDKVGDRPAVGVRATREGRRPVSLFFDKEKGWLLKYEVRVRAAANREAAQEVILSDYRPDDGLVRPHKVVVKRDGRVLAEMDVTEFKPLEKADDKTFARP